MKYRSKNRNKSKKNKLKSKSSDGLRRKRLTPSSQPIYQLNAISKRGNFVDSTKTKKESKIKEKKDKEY